MTLLIKVDKPNGRVRSRSLIDYSGRRYGRLIAVGMVERDERYNDHLWLFKCDCGNAKRIRIKSVRKGHTSSCGCIRKEQLIERNTTHGLSRKYHREWRIWKGIKSRCSDACDLLYGGRGITVCDRWVNSFADFMSDMGKCPLNFSIERLDVNGNYEPANCVWASAETQANNKRNTRQITINGVTKSLSQWCRYFGTYSSKVRYRLAQGWDVVDAFSR